MTAITLLAFHLQGQHDQVDHGRSKGGLAGVSGDTLRGGGATYNLRSRRAPARGYAVSPYPERSRAIPLGEFRENRQAVVREFVKSNRDLLAQNKHYIGTWNDSETGKVYLDVSVIETSKGRAINLAKERDQIAIFDMKSFETIEVDRSAKSGAK